MDIDVQQPAAAEPSLEPGLLTGLAERRVAARGVAGLEVASGLKPAAALPVVHEERPLAGVVDHDRRGGEVRLGLLPRERLCQRARPSPHALEVGRLAGVGRLVRGEESDELFPRHSYWSACRTFSRAARRAGKIAATIPAITAAIRNTIS